MSEETKEVHLEANQTENNDNKPSAPPANDENGFYVVDQIEKVINTITETANKEKEEISKFVENLQIPTPEPQQQTTKHEEPQQPAKHEESKSKDADSSKSTKSTKSNGVCTACPYYLLGFSCLKNMNLPPKVKDLILWNNPKCTGAVFGTSLVLLISLATFSLFTVIGSLSLLALTAAGAYRLYLSLLFRIKGTYDDTFDKLSSMSLSLPKDKVKDLSNLIETDVNRALNKFKSIILWDNVMTSAIALIGFYFVYCIGCVFNSLTLLIIALVSVFTLPKVYHVYQKPIDQALQKAADFSHNLAKQVLEKLPFLHKKKSD